MNLWKNKMRGNKKMNSKYVCGTSDDDLIKSVWKTYTNKT